MTGNFCEKSLAKDLATKFIYEKHLAINFIHPVQLSLRHPSKNFLKMRINIQQSNLAFENLMMFRKIIELIAGIENAGST